MPETKEEPMTVVDAVRKKAAVVEKVEEIERHVSVERRKLLEPLEPELQAALRRKIELDGKVADIEAQVARIREALLKKLQPEIDAVKKLDPLFIAEAKKHGGSVIVDDWKIRFTDGYERKTPLYKKIAERLVAVPWLDQEDRDRMFSWFTLLKNHRSFCKTSKIDAQLTISKKEDFDVENG
jgi:hypothetical protein